MACRWKYDVETFPWKIEENLKIAVEEVLVEVALPGIFRHQDKRDIAVCWGRSQQAEQCAHVG